MTRRRTVPAALLAAACAVLALAGCGSSGGSKHDDTTSGGAAELVGKTLQVKQDPSAVGPVTRAEQAFSIALLKQLGTGTQNVSASPASLAIALAMVENGASGQTKQQIQKALQTSGLDDATQNAGWQQLTQGWTDAAKDGSFALSTANSAWVQRGFPIEQAYLNAIKTYYGAGLWQADFEGHNSAALAAIDKWTSQHTNGKITKLFDKLPRDTRLVLADAVYFKAAWESPFNPRDTHDGDFTTRSGTTVQAKFMHDEEGAYPVSIGSDYSAVQLPYQGDRFAALAIMPKSGSLADFTAGLTADRLTQITSSLKDQDVDLALPKFTTSSTLNLRDTLAKLGMTDAFTDSADFSALAKQKLQISQVIQRVYLSVGEKGTEAAAATGIGVVAGAAPQAPKLSITFDHPFLFLIRDTKTGAILFASEIADPAAT